MSWIVLLFGFFAILGASQFARFKGRGDRAVIAVLLAGFIVSVGYVFVGEAGLPDRPYSVRAAELAERDALSLTPAETLARLESLVRSQPDDPQPHFFIGEMMRGQGRDEDAVRAYQSALRRDDRFVPAMIALADALTRLSGGRVNPDAKRIYARAVVIDPTQARAGFLAGYADWQNGDREAARTRWDTVREALDPADPRTAMLEALIAEAVAEDTP